MSETRVIFETILDSGIIDAGVGIVGIVKAVYLSSPLSILTSAPRNRGIPACNLIDTFRTISIKCARVINIEIARK